MLYITHFKKEKEGYRACKAFVFLDTFVKQFQIHLLLQYSFILTIKFGMDFLWQILCMYGIAILSTKWYSYVIESVPQ